MGTQDSTNYFCYRYDATPFPCCYDGVAGGGGDGWFANPIHARNGDKVQDEIDYQGGSIHPLTLRRHYLNFGFPWYYGATPPQSSFGPWWRTDFDHRIYVYRAAGVNNAIVYRGNGATLYFYGAGGNWLSRPEQKERLATASGGGWQLSAANDDVETYDATGRLVSIVNRAGWTWALAYNGNGQLATVTDSMGRQLTFTYGSSGWVSQVQTPDGNSVAYTYDVNGRVASVTYPASGMRQYLYDEPSYQPSNPAGLLTGVVDENGNRFATYTYDSQGHALSSQHGNGVELYSVVSNPSSSTGIVTDPLGVARTFSFTQVQGFTRLSGISSPCSNCGNASQSLTYDANGNLASRTDFNNRKVCYTYDLSRNLETARVEGAQSSEPCATVLTLPPTRPDVRKVTTTWHPTYRLHATITEPAPGGTRTTTFTYDTSGNLTRKSIAAPANDGTGTTITRIWDWTYTTYGRVLTATDPDNHSTTTTYYADNDADPGKRGNVATITNAAGHVTQLTAYDANGRPLSFTDPNFLVTTLTYHPRGWISSRQVGSELTTYSYDAVGQLTKVTLPDSSYLEYSYDAAHRLTQISDSLGNKIVYTLDAMGNRIQEQAFDQNNVLSRSRQQVYDSLNRLHQSVGAQ